jgi:putative SOS response-associated peptidase YedK
MCGRYVLKTSAIRLERELGLEEAAPFEAHYNLAPMQAAPIITDAAPRKLTVAQWGLLPFWAKDVKLASKLINARAETLEQKPAFRDLLKTHRCLVPADGFYEWKRFGAQRTPHFIRRADEQLLTMAGLWSTWKSPDGLEVVTFTIVTTEANGMMRELHDRMPVLLDEAGREAWLSKEGKPGALLVPWHGAPLEQYEVAPQVNSVAFDGPACIEPAKVVQLSLL